MKLKLISACMAATFVVSCGDKKKEADAKDTDKDVKEQKTPEVVKETPTPKEKAPEVVKEAPKPDPVVEEPVKPVEAGDHSKISASLEGKTRVLKDGEFVAQDVSKKNDYYLVYFSASW